MTRFQWYKVTALPSEQTEKPSWLVFVIQGRVAAFSGPIVTIGDDWNSRLAAFEERGWKVEELPSL